MYSNVKKDIPKQNYAELIRDFRIDEEEGMKPDSKLESKSKFIEKREITDEIFSIKQMRTLSPNKV